ncbi:hypothetical protein SAMN02745664_10110 [Moraxella cuniculi DSM 21768]|uniref:DUF2059 domain-containing protein n=1 Tax=Moraxella cuniculi DSM 21768 TaxID=1122245 RepID=A0A1N7D5Y0_9GAMM|nr:hypothetical protein [Moraxella cuniculi]OOS07845.1 hypothetical protein B0189_00340 [Moraxella cuniculi]SIR71218.1 hypothetical protein SAMN02745664_10110 [Moraxella cuniculi DSM 21768]
MKLFNLTAISLAMLLTLTACGGDKPAETTQEVKTETATETKAETTSETTTDTGAMPAEIDKLIIQSPYMEFSVQSNRTFVVNHIKSESQLTPEQNACLLSLEGNPNYLEILEPYVKGILSDDEIKEADEFFASDAGRKFAEMMLNQMGAENLPPFVEPTDSEKAEIAKAMLKPFFVKMQAKQDAMSEQEALDFIALMVNKEKARCQIS